MSKKYREAAKEGSADISAKVPRNLVKKMDAQAKREGKTRSAFIVTAIAEYLDRYASLCKALDGVQAQAFETMSQTDAPRKRKRVS